MAKNYYSDAYKYIKDSGTISTTTLATLSQMAGKAPACEKNGNVKSVLVTHTVTAAFASGDILYMSPIPKGAKISRLFYTNTDLDSGTTVTHKSGLIVADDDCFEAAGATTLRGAATTSIADSVLSAAVVAGADDHVALTFGAASTATSGTISMLIQYFVP